MWPSRSVQSGKHRLEPVKVSSAVEPKRMGRDKVEAQRWSFDGAMVNGMGSSVRPIKRSWPLGPRGCSWPLWPIGLARPGSLRRIARDFAAAPLAPHALSKMAVAALSAAYRPRRPTETVLYSIVREHLETFLAHARESYGAPLPLYVENEFREYLRCGVFAYGFVRARCESCEHDLLVAFSCKLRGVCPSCAGRRMSNEAASLVDRVLPAVPVRQWVLSLPFELRALAAFNARVLTALSRIFVDAVSQWYRGWADRTGIGDRKATRPGAVTFVQRFGSSLNLNVHFHTCFLDGIYVRDATGQLVFHSATSPNRDDLDGVLCIVRRRALRWLARHGHLERSSLEEQSNEAPTPTAIEACAAIAGQRGQLRTLAAAREAPDLREPAPGGGSDDPVRDGQAAEHKGFNLHARSESRVTMISVASDSAGMGRDLRSRSNDSARFRAAASHTASRRLVLAGQNIG